MERITTVFILLFIISTAFAGPKQKADSTSTKKKFPVVELGLNYSNDIVSAYKTETCLYCQLLAPQEVPAIPNNVQQKRIHYGYTTSINVQVDLAKHWSLETGVQFADKGFQSIYSGAGPGFDRNYNYYYTSIPVKADFITGKKKVRFIAGAGGALDISVNSAPTPRMNFTPMVSTGFDYGFCKHFHLRVEPTFRYSVFPFTNYPYPTRLWSVGLNTGIYYAF